VYTVAKKRVITNMAYLLIYKEKEWDYELNKLIFRSESYKY
jgi:hypothetical protein